MAKITENEPTSINLLGAGTIIKGEIISNGDIRIDGTLNGNLESKGKVIVGATGIIEGDVICQNADISGSVIGKITVNELLSLKASSTLKGDAVAGKLSIEPGAMFSGTCSMEKPRTNLFPKTDN